MKEKEEGDESNRADRQVYVKTPPPTYAVCEGASDDRSAYRTNAESAIKKGRLAWVFCSVQLGGADCLYVHGPHSRHVDRPFSQRNTHGNYDQASGKNTGAA